MAPVADGLLAVLGKPPYASCVVGEPLRGKPDAARGATAKADAADAHGAESDVDTAVRAPDAPATAEHAAQAKQVLTMFHEQPARWLETSKAKWREQRRAKDEKAAALGERRPPGGEGGAKVSRARGQHTMRDLLAAGLVTASPRCMFLVYQAQTYTASLEADGALVGVDGARFLSPSAWAIHCKRQTNPDKRSDDGYGSPTGPTLEQLKARLPQPEAPPAAPLHGSSEARVAALRALLGDDVASPGDAGALDAMEWQGQQHEQLADVDGAPVELASSPTAAVDGSAVDKSPGFLARPGYDFLSLVGRAVELKDGYTRRWQRGVALSYDAGTRTLTLRLHGGGADVQLDADAVAGQGALNVLLR